MKSTTRKRFWTLKNAVKSIVVFLSLATLSTVVFTFGRASASDHFSFSGYPAAEVLSRKPAKLDSSSDDRFQALKPVVQRIIAEDVAKGPNYAGVYRLIEVGCGTACQNIAAIDLRTGKIVWAPIATSAGVLFRKDSRLIIVKEDKQYQSPRRYFVLQNSAIREIK